MLLRYVYFWTLVRLNALLGTFSCVYSEIMFTIISFFQKLIKWGGGWSKNGGLENFSKLNKQGGRLFGTRKYNLKMKEQVFLYRIVIMTSLEKKSSILNICLACEICYVWYAVSYNRLNWQIFSNEDMTQWLIWWSWMSADLFLVGIKFLQTHLLPRKKKYIFWITLTWKFEQILMNN